MPFEHVAQLRFPAAQSAIDRVFWYAEEFGNLGRRQIVPVRQLERGPLDSGYLPECELEEKPFVRYGARAWRRASGARCDCVVDNGRAMRAAIMGKEL